MSSDHEYKPEHATDTAYKAPAFIETYSGRAVWPLKPKLTDFSVIDIAHHLSNQSRYSGATSHFYCTAQHCCLLADYVKKIRHGTALDCLQILMHDGAECYLVDIPRPVKQFMPQYRVWDRDITMKMREWLGLDGVPIPPWQDELDSRIVIDERDQLMSDSGLDWEHPCEPLGINIDPWTPREAEQQFLMRYAQFSFEHFGAHQYLRSGWGIKTHSVYTPEWRTAGSDVLQRGEVNQRVVTDLLEVDIRGGVGRVAVRSPDGMMVRDLDSGSFPRPAWKFIHGKFDLIGA